MANSSMADLFGWFALSFLFVSSGAALTSAADTSPVSFDRDVLPILSRRCFPCHGPDEAAREAGLRLDRRDEATSRRESSAPILPGKPQESSVWLRVSSRDGELRMPPPPNSEPLSPAEQQTIRRWIDEGARYEQHWAMKRPMRPEPPDVHRVDWVRNPIDRFVLAKMEQAGLQPSPEAEPRTLLRRAALHLTGFPPNAWQAEAILVDKRPGAYERLVDELIVSPAFAERAAQDWLDLARYADTRGFADDQMRTIWPWRDWVIRSYMADRPFNEFTIEQLAGDMLPQATMEQRLASAFHRNAPQAKGQTYPVEEYRIKGVIDRVNTTGRIWLGLTIGCAQCHDHKFDAISQQDYYSLFALFNNIEHSGQGFQQGGPTMVYRPEGIERTRRLIVRDLAEARKKSSGVEFPKKHPALIKSWIDPNGVLEEPTPAIQGDFTITANIVCRQEVGDIVSCYDWRARERGFVFGVGGEGESTAPKGTLFAWVSSKRDPFAGVEVYGSTRVDDGRPHRVAVVYRAGKDIRLFVDGVEDRAATVRGVAPMSIATPQRSLAIGGGYRDSKTPNAFLFHGKIHSVRLYQQAVVRQDPIIARCERELAEFDRLHRADVVSEVPVMKERENPRLTHVHVRGNFLRLGKRVSPGVPEVFRPLTTGPVSDRLALARWLLDQRHPLTARVVVNRLWRSCFGVGLVPTSDDFGVQGSRPTHPLLLDWLACELIENDWDMRRLHRMLVTSATFRQATAASRTRAQIDPENIFLSRMNRVRLAAEQIRDQSLAVSGLLDRRMCGPPVFPDQPRDYWKQRALPGVWKNSVGGDRYRRTIYTYWRRMALHPSLELWNAPARSVCISERVESTLPTQALALLNDPIQHEAAHEFARLLLRERNTDSRRVRLAFERLLCRSPTLAEERAFVQFLEAEDHGVRERGERSVSPADSPELLAWTALCSVLLNLDETITRP